MEINVETYIAIASAFIAVCALGVTVWQGRQNHKHNKMSVRPKITTMENFDDDGRNRTVSFELINSGFGPAIIKDFILVYDGEEVSKNNRKTYEDFLKEKVKSQGCKIVNIVSFAPDSALLVNERCELLSFHHRVGEDASFINKLDLRVNYQSIYEDETYTYDSRKDRLYHGLEDEE
jgi:hypothetical protein